MPCTMALPPHFARLRRSLCMFLGLPPMYVSSHSTGAPEPPIFMKEPVSIALRMRWSMNHAVFWVTPKDRAISHELTPFLQLQIIHAAVSHLSIPSAESSKILPTLMLNCFRGCLFLHSQRRRVAMKRTSLLPHVGHSTPFGQRRAAKKSMQRSGS